MLSEAAVSLEKSFLNMYIYSKTPLSFCRTVPLNKEFKMEANNDNFTFKKFKGTFVPSLSSAPLPHKSIE